MPSAQPRRDGSELVLREKAAEPAETETVAMFQLIGYQCAGDEAASPTPADESAVASLPRAQDEGPGEVKVSLMQVRTHLRSMQVKRQANRRHSLVRNKDHENDSNLCAIDHKCDSLPWVVICSTPN